MRLLLLLPLCCTLALGGNERLIRSCSKADIQSAVDSARPGDTIYVPPGFCSFSSLEQGVSFVPFELAIIGDGPYSTIIESNHVDTSNRAIFWLGSGGDGRHKMRISGFTFSGTPSSKGIIQLNGRFNFRIDHNKFTPNQKFLEAWGQEYYGEVGAYGVLVDHNALSSTGSMGMNINGRTSNTWADGNYWRWGKLDGAFAEENYVDGTSGTGSFVSLHNGGRAVVRHNTMLTAMVTAHGADSDARAGGGHEIYHNRWNGGTFRLRGGSSVIWGNSITSAVGGDLMVYRVCYDRGWTAANVRNQSRCDGSQVIDGNLAIPGPNSAEMGEGTHTGANNAAALTDNAAAYSTDEWLDHWIYNDTDGSRCKVTANTGTEVTCTLTGGTENDWDTGDEYHITNGWPCSDQPGRGPNWAVEPVYQWDNIGSFSLYELLYSSTCANSVELPAPTGYIVSGRDFYNGTAKPDYVPAAYPHPFNRIPVRSDFSNGELQSGGMKVGRFGRAYRGVTR